MKGLAGLSLHMWIVPKPLASEETDAVPVPFCRYVNLSLVPGSTLQPGTHTLILPNHLLPYSHTPKPPATILSYSQTTCYHTLILPNHLLPYSHTPKPPATILSYSQTTCNHTLILPNHLQPYSHTGLFLSHISGGFQATLLLENPKGDHLLTYDEMESQVSFPYT